MLVLCPEWMPLPDNENEFLMVFCCITLKNAQVASFGAWSTNGHIVFIPV